MRFGNGCRMQVEAGKAQEKLDREKKKEVRRILMIVQSAAAL